MQSPTIVFDHVNKVVLSLAPGAALDKKLAEIAAATGTQKSGSAAHPAS